MKKLLVALILLFLISCSNNKNEPIEKQFPDRISIFEIYLKKPKQVDKLFVLFRDTLNLPVEWAPFDFFGDGVVHDAALYLGNTTLEFLALSEGDSAMDGNARYNRMLFESEDINNSTAFLVENKLQHGAPFDFNISSNKSSLTIGKQVNLDSLSVDSNVNIAIWQYLPAGYNFFERGIKSDSKDELKHKLDRNMELNPLGIVGLKEIQLILDRNAIESWQKLLGPADQNKWQLQDGLRVSYLESSVSKGIDLIVLGVNDLPQARAFLSTKNLIGHSQKEDEIIISQEKIYGLKIYLAEY